MICINTSFYCLAVYINSNALSAYSKAMPYTDFYGFSDNRPHYGLLQCVCLFVYPVFVTNPGMNSSIKHTIDEKVSRDTSDIPNQVAAGSA